MAQPAGAALPTERTPREQPAPKGKIVPLRGSTQGKSAQEHELTDQDLVTVLTFFFM